MNTGRLFAILMLLLSPAALAAELGDPAPPLEIQDWVKGEAVTLEELRGKVVVVEFWATWCPPCRESIPHLTTLQKQYKDKMVLIGVSNEPAAVVQPFVTRMDAQMDYHVATDLENKTTMAYMRGYGQSGIPHAFIVDQKGNMVWHDSPLSPVFEQVLGEVVAGNFDSEKFLAAQKQREENIALANRYVMELSEGKSAEELKPVGEQVLKAFENDAEILIQIAMVLASDDFKDKTDLSMAIKAVDRAVALTEGKQAMALQAKARVLEVEGKKEEALKVQQQAIDAAQSPDEKEYLQERYDEISKSGATTPEAAQAAS